MHKTLEYIAFVAILALCVFGTIAAVKYGVKTEDVLCCYCHSGFTSESDIVVMTDGRRAHAECYLDNVKEVHDDTN